MSAEAVGGRSDEFTSCWMVWEMVFTALGMGLSGTGS